MGNGRWVPPFHFYLVRGASEGPCRELDIFIWGPQGGTETVCWIQSRRSEGEILWPAGELAALGVGYASGVCGTRMDEIK